MWYGFYENNVCVLRVICKRRLAEICRVIVRPVSCYKTYTLVVHTCHDAVNASNTAVPSGDEFERLDDQMSNLDTSRNFHTIDRVNGTENGLHG